MSTPDSPRTEALRAAFERLVGNRDSYGLRRSRRGTYVNPAIARDWKWFQAGAAASEDTAPDLLAALRSCLAMLERADCSTGYCCCGSSVEGHGIGDGHGPVDEGSYHQCNAMDAARAALAKSAGAQA